MATLQQHTSVSLSYDEALAYLRSFPDWERGTAGGEETYTLDRMARLLAVLEQPDRAYPIVHVVGTKGKGSTAAMLSSCLRAAGYRTGLFISPHLVDFRERVQVDGRCIPRDALAAIVSERLRPAVESLRASGLRPPLHFEMLCALAFEHFRRSAVDVAVVEAGLGGRLDATNAVTETALTAITTLGYDHMAVLGHTLAAIAFEKAAVIRQGGLAVTAPQLPEAMEVVERVCAERGATLHAIGRDWLVTDVAETREGTMFALQGPDVRYERLTIPLLGAHQAANAAVAVAAATLLHGRFARLDEAAIRHGLAATRWPGRLHTVPGTPPVVLDAAHNKESAEALAATLARLYPHERFVLVVAVFADKNACSILAPLAPLAERVIVTAANHPRARSAETLAEAARALGLAVEQAPSVATALERARTLAGERGRVLVTGSVRTVGEAMDALGLDGCAD